MFPCPSPFLLLVDNVLLFSLLLQFRLTAMLRHFYFMPLLYALLARCGNVLILLIWSIYTWRRIFDDVSAKDFKFNLNLILIVFAKACPLAFKRYRKK